MDLKKSEGAAGGITRLLPDGRLGSHYYYTSLKKDPLASAASVLVNNSGDPNMNHRFPVMTASVPQTEAASAASVVNKQTSTQASSECSSFTDLLSSVLSPEEAVTGFEAAACVDLSALDGLNLDFPLLHHHHNGNTTLATERALCRNEHSVTSTSYTHSSNVSELVAAAIMASSEDSEAGNFPESKPLLSSTCVEAAVAAASVSSSRSLPSYCATIMTTSTTNSINHTTRKFAEPIPPYHHGHHVSGHLLQHHHHLPHQHLQQQQPQQPPQHHYAQHQHLPMMQHHETSLDDNSSMCSSPSPPSSRSAHHFYHYQGSFYGHHQPLIQPLQPSHMMTMNLAAASNESAGLNKKSIATADKAALHVVVTSASSSSSSGSSSSAASSCSTASAASAGPPSASSASDEIEFVKKNSTPQQQLLLMRVSSVKSSASNSSSSSKADNEPLPASNLCNNNRRPPTNNKGNTTDQVLPRQTTNNSSSSSQEDTLQGLDYSQQHDLADQLLQQCLVPMVPNARELTGGVWFRCRLCGRIELTSRLSAHARQVHHTDHVAECISSLEHQLQQQQNGGQHEVSPPWCEGAFPSDLEDVTLSPNAGNLKASSFNAMDATSGSSCSPPSVTDLTTLNPQDHFDPDFDVVDDMKFIDSLIRTMPEDQQPSNNNQQPPMAFENSSKSNNDGLQPHVMYHSPTTSHSMPTSTSVATSAAVAAASTALAASSLKTNNSNKKSSPQFRWRRRKRRSKAQYPEMSRYLLPTDDGEEVQHLGRTLECTLCGLRGKRCHLTLHFKAKHNEVIDLAGVNRNNNNKTNNKPKTASTTSLQVSDHLAVNCWQSPPLHPQLQQHQNLINMTDDSNDPITKLEAVEAIQIPLVMVTSSPTPPLTEMTSYEDEDEETGQGGDQVEMSEEPTSSPAASAYSDWSEDGLESPAAGSPMMLDDNDVVDNEIDEEYWRKYPDLKPGSMTRVLSDSEADGLSRELSEAAASFQLKDLFVFVGDDHHDATKNIHDVCGDKAC